MIIDCHAHLMPQSWFHPKSPKSIFDLDGLFKEQDEAGVDITVFGNNWIRSPDGADPLRVVQEFNAHAAELTAKHPKRLLGLACSVPYDNDKILKETEKAIREYKLKGIMIGSSTNGEYLDSPRATPFFELVSDLDVPLFVHPPKVHHRQREDGNIPSAGDARPAVRHDARVDPLHLYRRFREISQVKNGLRSRRRRAADAAGPLWLRLRIEKG